MAQKDNGLVLDEGPSQLASKPSTLMKDQIGDTARSTMYSYFEAWSCHSKFQVFLRKERAELYIYRTCYSSLSCSRCLMLSSSLLGLCFFNCSRRVFEDGRLNRVCQTVSDGRYSIN